MSVSILRGDARELPLPDASVDLIVTSPPYFGLRAYQDDGEIYEDQIGLEETPKEYLDNLLDCTREWMRVLKSTGNIFVNCGDKYSQYEGARKGHGRSITGERISRGEPLAMPVSAPSLWGIKSKSLMGLPWRYAVRCMDELGLILRAEIIWSKVNGLPESVTDRVRRSHEQVFHFTKQQKYFAAVDEIREPHAEPGRIQKHYGVGYTAGAGERRSLGVRVEKPAEESPGYNPLGKLPGSVWSIPTSPLKVPEELGVDHFAAYPPELCRKIILGWSPKEICEKCNEPRRPVTKISHEKGWTRRTSHDEYRHSGESSGQQVNNRQLAEITGYACYCIDDSAPSRPSVVLDPFGGTGTTAMTADVLGRHGISVDASYDYCKLASWRTADPYQRAKVLGEKLEKVPSYADQPSLFEEE